MWFQQRQPSIRSPSHSGTTTISMSCILGRTPKKISANPAVGWAVRLNSSDSEVQGNKGKSRKSQFLPFLEVPLADQATSRTMTLDLIARAFDHQVPIPS